ncbi:cytochrome P450 [Streptomyces sp. YIM 98790]|uniref:cytochrome P450 n=1 Tax=Streptomyces sp. YIM 98790 TaxID=2689077 RepID=UPI001407C1E4
MVSLPYWLPPVVVALRVRVFARVNGEEGITAPGREVPAEEFRTVYGHPAANGRSRGAALSDLFWYWLSPGPEVHQEHLEPGPRYDDVARTTRRILAGPSREEWAELTARCTRQVLDELAGPDGAARNRVRTVRLRDMMMPVWAGVYYEAVFREPCPRPVRELITGHADDVVSALKCTGLRHMDRRQRLTAYLRERLAGGPPPVPLPATLTAHEQALYLQGTFFNTAVVQMSEAMAHLLLALATHRPVQDRLLSGEAQDDYLDRVVDETLHHFPLFGIAHRITTGEIHRPGREPVPAGSVLLFNYPEYHRSGTPGGGTGHRPFDPDRWLSPDTRPAAYIPFGVTANRPCPARGFAVLTMRVAAREVLRRYRLESSAEHTRSLPSRGPCLLVPRTGAVAWGPVRRRVRLERLRLADRWAAVPRSLTQLALGSYMVWDARRQGLCRNYFADAPPAPRRPRGAAGDPGGGSRR